MNNIEIITSKDGSHTLFNKELNETYHSIHGAINESKHVFIDSGLDYFIHSYPTQKPIILEIGFGTGLNVFLSAIYALKNKVKIEIITLEKFPLSLEVISNLNYSKEIQNNIYEDLFLKLHKAEWSKKVEISEYVSLTKLAIGLEDYKGTDHNLVYFDAFAPNKQEELWNINCLSNVSKCKVNSIFVTYCAKGQVRRNLQSIGWSMDRIPGPPGKREMLRGTKEK